jgi:pyridoxal phosphate enzyme (YggS family)
MHLRDIQKAIPGHVKLVAVSKTVGVETILEAYHTGHKIFGENRAQSLLEKQPLLPADIEWHFIGHLQTNKVKYIAPFISMIHSVDSFKLLKEIDREAARNNRSIDCLLQFHIATEETKYGLDMAEAMQLLGNPEISLLKSVRICGVMGMATFTEDPDLVRREFRNLAGIYKELKNGFFSGIPYFKEISMGMSGDYQIAIEEGSTIVRIGTAIFT